MQLRIATYNVNSIRIRLRELKRLVAEEEPHILCVQETKVEDHIFPEDEIKKLGFRHLYFRGQKSYNGVAIFSNQPLTLLPDTDFMKAGHKRHIGARLKDGTEIHNFYVPAGGDIPDPKLNPKFEYKLQFYDALAKWSLAQKKKKVPIIMLGDFNVAPLENDVWSHKQLLGIVSHTPVETSAMEKLRRTLDWIDSSRHFTPATEKLYSWWSYRNQDWKKSDRGRRLDHIWVTPQLGPALQSSRILKHARDWANPSDHVPVITALSL